MGTAVSRCSHVPPGPGSNDLGACDLPPPGTHRNTATAAGLPYPAARAQVSSVSLYSSDRQTETKRILYLPPQELKKRPGPVGIAIPGTEVWLEGRRENVSRRERGAAVVRGGKS